MSKTCWQKKSLRRKSKTCSRTYAVQNQTEAFCTRQEKRKALIETEPQAARPRSQNPRTSGRNKCSRRRRGTLRETGRAYQTTRLRRKIESRRRTPREIDTPAAENRERTLREIHRKEDTRRGCFKAKTWTDANQGSKQRRGNLWAKLIRGRKTTMRFREERNTTATAAQKPARVKREPRQ
jgi:hypothetical protein